MTPLKKGLEMAKGHSAEYNGSLHLKEEYNMTFSEYSRQKGKIGRISLHRKQ